MWTRLSRVQREVLEYVYANTVARPHELAYRLGLSDSAVQSALHRLVKAGLLERVGRGLYAVPGSERSRCRRVVVCPSCGVYICDW